MADENNQIIIEVVLDDGSIAKGFAKLNTEAKESASYFSRIFKIDGLADLNAAFNLAGKAVGIFTSSLKAGIDESIGGEKATVQLAAAMKSVPGVTDEAVRSFQNFTSELSKKIAIDDDVINSSAKLLASLGRLSGEGLEQATAAAADLSAGLGIGLEEASARLARAAEGNVTAFSKLGFQFTKGATDAQLLQEALTQIQGRFGGVAESLATNTFEGVLKRLKVAFDDSNQALGDFITKSPVVREILKIIAEAFEKSTEFLKSVAGQKFLDNVILQIVQFATYVNQYLIAPLEMFYNFSKVVFDGFVIAIQTAIAGLGQLGGAVAFVLQKLGVENGLVNALNTFKESSADALASSINGFKGFQDVLNTPLAESLGTSLDGLNARLISVKDNTLDAVEATKTGASSMVTELSKAAVQINSIYQQGILKTISAGAQALGASLVKGGAAFSDFSNIVLNIIGDMAIQIGTTLVGVGLGIESLKLALGTLTGGPAIAAGLALIAIGGLLKSLSSGGAATASGGAAGVDLSTPGGGGGESPISGAAQERKPAGELVVNINGDILGDEGSGQRLAQLLNAAFDASGINLRQGII